MTKIRLPMPTYNCFAECGVGQADNPRYKNAHVDSRIEPLIVELGRKRPQWKFVTYRQGTLSADASYADHHTFYIEEDDENLGEIYIERNWRTGESSFCMENSRLRRQRERSGPTKTIHLKKATKLVLDNYVASSIGEKMQMANGAATSAVQSADREATYAFTNLIDKLRVPMATCLVEDAAMMAELRKRLEGAAQHDAVDKLPEAFSRLEDARMVFGAMQHGQGVTIIMQRDKYHMLVGDIIQEHTSDTLPDWVKRGIGLLKLTEPKTLVPGTGMRVDATTFFVINTGE